MKNWIIFIGILVAICCLTAQEEQNLVGEADLEKVFSFEEGYNNKVALYEPKEEAIEFLSSYDKEVLIETVYGSWCKDSILNVPRFIKTIQEANNPNLKTAFIGVDRKKKAPDNLLEGKNIERVPTFIVYSGEKELGRIIENPTVSIEEDLVEILKKE